MPSRSSTRSNVMPRYLRRISALRFSLLVASLAFFSSGCSHHHAVALPPITEAPQPKQPATIPPIVTSKPTESTPTTTAQPPATQTQTPPVTATPPADAPSKPADAAPKKPVAEPPRPPAPQISPQISPSDQAALQNQTNQFISDTEKNLRLADRRDLNANQRDLVEKIHGFVGQARDAIKSSDWTRAKNLAQKAYLLSVELANSLQ